MNRIITNIIFTTILLTSATIRLHASTYGDGLYGDGVYSPSSTPTPTTAPTSTPTPTSAPTNTPTVTPTSTPGPSPTPTPSARPSSSTNTGTVSGSNSNHCSAQAPGSSPFLYQVDRLSGKATLYFTPPHKPYDKFIISYGLDENAENYNATYQVSNSEGAIDYTVDLLEPGVTYFFKVRALNTCQPSEWSNVIKGDAISPNLITTASYYPSWYQQITHTVSTFVKTVTNTISQIVAPRSNTPSPAPVETKESSVPVNNPQPVQNETQEDRNQIEQQNPQVQQPSRNTNGSSQTSSGNWFTNIFKTISDWFNR